MPAFLVNGMVNLYNPFTFTIRDNWSDHIDTNRSIFVRTGDELFGDRGSGFSSIVLYSPQGNYTYSNNYIIYFAYLTTGLPSGDYPQGHNYPIFTVDSLGVIKMNTNIFSSINPNNSLTLAMKICIRINDSKSNGWGIAVCGLGFAMGMIGYGSYPVYATIGYAKPEGLALGSRVGISASPSSSRNTWFEIDVRLKYTGVDTSGTQVSGSQKGRIFRISDDFGTRDQVFPTSGGWSEYHFNNVGAGTAVRPTDPLGLVFNSSFIGGQATVNSGDRIWIDYIRVAGAWANEFDLYNAP